MNTGYIAGAVALAVGIPCAIAGAQDRRDLEQRPITLIGCVMAETQYRDLFGPGRSGPSGAGIGGRDEFVLVDAREVPAGTTAEADASAGCAPTPAGLAMAYELTGDGEEGLAALVGRRAVVSGTRKAADDAQSIGAGQLRVDGGFDPLGHELHLVEVNVESSRLPAVLRAEAPAAAPPPAAAARPSPLPEAAPAPEREIAAAPAPPPAPAPEREAAPVPAPEPRVQRPEPVPQVARRDLPRTASPVPLAGLLGLASLAAAAGVRAWRRRSR